MKFKSTKKASDIALDGITVELDVVDSAVKAITLTDPKGSIVRIAHRDYSSMYVEVPAPPELVKRWKLSGHVLSLPVDKLFDTEYDANDERQRLERACREESDSSLKVEQVEVPVAA